MGHNGLIESHDGRVLLRDAFHSRRGITLAASLAKLRQVQPRENERVPWAGAFNAHIVVGLVGEEHKRRTVCLRILKRLELTRRPVKQKTLVSIVWRSKVPLRPTVRPVARGLVVTR